MHYDWLMDIFNELDRDGICMTVVLVGQEELLDQRIAFLQNKKVQIIGRFMVHTFKFEGIRRFTDLKTCLTGFDDYSEYPPESGWSFTRYYFPEAFDQGFRLQSCAEEMFDVLNDLRREHGIKKALEIPMQYVTLTIEYCLKHFGADGHDVKWINKAHWREAIERSGYIEAEMYQEIV